MEDTALRQRFLTEAPVIEQLSEEELADLLAMVAVARRSRRKALFGAIDEALGHLPWMLRGTARKIVLG